MAPARRQTQQRARNAPVPSRSSQAAQSKATAKMNNAPSAPATIASVAPAAQGQAPAAKGAPAPAARPSRASKEVARKVIASVAGRKRAMPAADGDPEPASKKSKATIKAPVQRAQHAHISARAPSMQKHRRESTIRRVPRIEAPENTPDKQSDIEPASDNELLIVSLGRSKKSSQAATHQHLAEDGLEEAESEASSVDGSYAPDKASDEGSASEAEEMSADEEDEDDMLTQDLAAFEARLAAEASDGADDDDDDDSDLPPVLRRKQKKDKGKGRMLTADLSGSDSETERVLKQALIPRYASQHQAESGRPASSKPKPPTERELIERPTWKAGDFSDDDSVHYHGLPSDFASIIDLEEDNEHDAPPPIADIHVPADVPNVLPPDSYELVQPANPGAHLHLLQQHVHIVLMLQRTFLSNERSLIRDNAFPPAIERLQLVIKDMLDVCIEKGFAGLHTQVSIDAPFRKSLAALANQRISTFRSNVKKVTDAHVVPFYGLQPGPACAALVEWLLENLRYIYPNSYEKGTANWKQPYRHSAIPAIMRAAFWMGTSAVGLRKQDSYLVFDSSHDDRPSEQEVPIPMVALVGAAIHASLSEWKTGYHKKSFFTADAFGDPYDEHCTVLRGIKASNAAAYHNTMHWLFKEASGATQAPIITLAAAASALAMIDFANMEVD